MSIDKTQAYENSEHVADAHRLSELNPAFKAHYMKLVNMYAHQSRTCLSSYVLYLFVIGGLFSVVDSVGVLNAQVGGVGLAWAGYIFITVAVLFSIHRKKESGSQKVVSELIIAPMVTLNAISMSREFENEMAKGLGAYLKFFLGWYVVLLLVVSFVALVLAPVFASEQPGQVMQILLNINVASTYTLVIALGILPLGFVVVFHYRKLDLSNPLRLCNNLKNELDQFVQCDTAPVVPGELMKEMFG